MAKKVTLKTKIICAGVGNSAARQTRSVRPMTVQCWPAVYDVGPPPNQPRPNTPAWRDERLSLTSSSSRDRNIARK